MIVIIGGIVVGNRPAGPSGRPAHAGWPGGSDAYDRRVYEIVTSHETLHLRASKNVNHGSPKVLSTKNGTCTLPRREGSLLPFLIHMSRYLKYLSPKENDLMYILTRTNARAKLRAYKT